MSFILIGCKVGVVPIMPLPGALPKFFSGGRMADLELLDSCMQYGANISGKSDFLRAGDIARSSWFLS